MADGCQTKNIEINPSTELLPDEYDIEKPSSVHIFRVKQDKGICQQLISSLKSCSSTKKIDITVYPMETKKSVEEKLDTIANMDYNNYSSMMLFMMGRTKITANLGVLLAEKEEDEPIQIEKVWSKFICKDSLRKKPKIFVFQATEIQKNSGGGVHTDSLKIGDCKLDFPLEADIFITYKNLESGANGDFIKSISKRISEYAHRDDIIDITTHAVNNYDYKVPRIISTLTRKFYFKSAPFRGYRHDVIAQVKEVETELLSLKRVLTQNNLQRARSGDLPRTTSLQNIKQRTPQRRNSVTSPYRSRLNSNSRKPWVP